MSGRGSGVGRGILQYRDDRKWPRNTRVLRPPTPGPSYMGRVGGKSKFTETRQPIKLEESAGEQNEQKSEASKTSPQSQPSYASILKNVPPSGDNSFTDDPSTIPLPGETAIKREPAISHVIVSKSPKIEDISPSMSPLFVVPDAPKASSWMEQSSMTDSEIMESLEKERLRFPSFETLCSPGAVNNNRASPTVDVFVTPPSAPLPSTMKSPSVSSMSCDNIPSNCDSPSDYSDSHGSYEFCCEEPDQEARYYARERQAPFRFKRPKVRVSMATTHDGILPCVNFRTTERMMERFANVAPFIDSHCHIDFLLDFARDQSWQDILDRHFHHRPRNFRGFIQVFCSHRRFRLDDPVLTMLRGRPDVWFAYGAHPKRLNDWSPRVLNSIRYCLTNVPNVVALGEIGLDYSQDFYKKADLQKEALRQQLKLAVELNLPIILHCREGHYSTCMDADQDLMDILQECVPTNHPMHLHCFTRDWHRGSRWLAAFPRLMIGLTPLVTQRGLQAVTALEVARNIPLDRVLIETDTPFFVPEEIDRRELTQSLPWFAITVAEQIANLREMSLDIVLGFILSNTHRLYGLNNAQRRARMRSVEFSM